MLTEQTIKVKWSGNNKKWYISKGYVFSKIGDEFDVNVNDLSKGSNSIVVVKCDYCNTEILIVYAIYLQHQKSIVKKDACSNCKNKKAQDVFIKKYGHISPTQDKNVIEKIKKTNLERYGCEFILQSPETFVKSKQTNLKKYGFENISQTLEIKEKKKQKSLDRYGVENPFQHNDIKDKIKETNLEKYGVEYPTQSKDILSKVRLSLYKSGNVFVSKQQKYIHNLIGGILNFPIGFCTVDIAINDIAIEYDGGGHELAIVHGDMSQVEFENRERKRYYSIINNGYRLITIKSNTDKLPCDEVLIKLINDAIKYLNTGHSWFEINIDKEMLRCSQYEVDFDFGKLRRIYKKHVENF